MHIPHGRHHHGGGPKPMRVYGRSPGHSPESVYPYPMDRRRRGYNRFCGKFCEGGRASPKDVGLIMLVLLLTAVAVGGLFLVIFFVVADSDSTSKEGKIAGELVGNFSGTSENQKVGSGVNDLEKDLQKLGNDVLQAIEDQEDRLVSETEYDSSKTNVLSETPSLPDDEDRLVDGENDVAAAGGRPVFVPRPPGPYEPSIPASTTSKPSSTTLFPGFTPESEEDSRKRTHSVNVPEPSSSAAGNNNNNNNNVGNSWWNVFFGEEPTTPRTRASTPISVVVPQAPIIPPLRAGSSGILDAIGIASRPSTTTTTTTQTQTQTQTQTSPASAPTPTTRLTAPTTTTTRFSSTATTPRPRPSTTTQQLQQQQQTQTHRYHDTFPYFQMVAQSNCNPRISQFLCSLLEPECGPQTPIKPPCRKFCRSAIEGCAEFIVPGLELSAAFDCRVYPDSYDPNECTNMARGDRCLNDEFQCPEDKSCIPRSWLCDGVQDCPSAADEMNCTKCAHDEFKCAVQHACIPDRWRCDGSPDCMDGSDENGCEILRQECGDGMFQCKDGIDCVPYRWRCDGTNQCRDNSDEADCQDLACHGDDFKCASNGICIPNVWVCDGRPDCADGTDEKNCRNKQKPQRPQKHAKPSNNPFVGTISGAPKVNRPPPPSLIDPFKNHNSNNPNNNNNKNGGVRDEQPQQGDSSDPETDDDEVPPAKENGIENRAGFVDRGPHPADVDQHNYRSHHQHHLVVQPGPQASEPVVLKPVVGYQSPWSWEPKYDRRR